MTDPLRFKFLNAIAQIKTFLYKIRDPQIYDRKRKGVSRKLQIYTLETHFEAHW